MKYLSYFQSPMLMWDHMRDQLAGRSGVYCLTNLINGKQYIGSAVDLNDRVRDYWQPAYKKAKANTFIVRAMNKYGDDNFSVGVLEYTSRDGAVAAEQRWIDELKPAYNILQQASSSLGYKHTPEGITKISEAMQGKERSAAVRADMSTRQMGAGNTFYGKKHSEAAKAALRAIALARTKSHKPAFGVVVTDTWTGITTTHSSIRSVTRALSCGIATVHAYCGSAALFKSRYRMTRS